MKHLTTIILRQRHEGNTSGKEALSNDGTRSKDGQSQEPHIIDERFLKVVEDKSNRIKINILDY